MTINVLGNLSFIIHRFGTAKIMILSLFYVKIMLKFWVLYILVNLNMLDAF